MKARAEYGFTRCLVDILRLPSKKSREPFSLFCSIQPGPISLLLYVRISAYNVPPEAFVFSDATLRSIIQPNGAEVDQNSDAWDKMDIFHGHSPFWGSCHCWWIR